MVGRVWNKTSQRGERFLQFSNSKILREEPEWRSAVFFQFSHICVLVRHCCEFVFDGRMYEKPEENILLRALLGEYVSKASPCSITNDSSRAICSRQARANSEHANQDDKVLGRNSIEPITLRIPIVVSVQNKMASVF